MGFQTSRFPQTGSNIPEAVVTHFRHRERSVAIQPIRKAGLPRFLRKLAMTGYNYFRHPAQVGIYTPLPLAMDSSFRWNDGVLWTCL